MGLEIPKLSGCSYITSGQEKPGYLGRRNSSKDTSGGQPYLMGKTTVPTPRVT